MGNTSTSEVYTSSGRVIFLVWFCFGLFLSHCLFGFLNKNGLVYVVIFPWQDQGWEGRGPEVKTWLGNGCCPLGGGCPALSPGGVPTLSPGGVPLPPLGRQSCRCPSFSLCLSPGAGPGHLCPPRIGCPRQPCQAPPPALRFLHPPTSPPPELLRTL